MGTGGPTLRSGPARRLGVSGLKVIAIEERPRLFTPVKPEEDIYDSN